MKFTRLALWEVIDKVPQDEKSNTLFDFIAGKIYRKQRVDKAR